MAPKHPVESETVLAHWMGILDANNALNVHGGVIMKLCDEAAGLAAIRHCSQRIVTVGVDRLTFMTPVAVGELVTFKAKVNAAWHTSMEVGVRVEAENPRSGELRHTTSAYLTMVCVDERGTPHEVPALIPQTEAEIRRNREAELRRANRLAERDEIERGRDGGLRPRR
ncbi:acyl-CoA thioesterase [Conexibacter sp. DBS9H8]|uniref:acyl-CoA thioesterase n=1 Tax=Conexibacter sp. DBS9H8 TaxID=2937801 RepID=UPI00200FF52C|nr:acyl-CoA thioesterase [Conexibacter sp. DBS9H8]